MKLKTVLIMAATALFSVSGNASTQIVLPNEGNYRQMTGEADCDYHIEVNSGAGRVFLTLISNQRTGEECRSSQTAAFQCDVKGECPLVEDQTDIFTPSTPKLQIINSRAFLSYDGKKYVYFNNAQATPAQKYSRAAWYGFKNVPGKSFTGQSRCAIFAPEGYYWCDDQDIARTHLCPKAREVAEGEAINACQSESGKNCEIINRGTENIVFNHSQGIFDNTLWIYNYASASLYCNVQGVVAIPIPVVRAGRVQRFMQ